MLFTDAFKGNKATLIEPLYCIYFLIGQKPGIFPVK